MIHLSNHALSVTIDPTKGAMITSLYNRLSQQEILKSISSETWPNGGIPILFPFAGRNWADNKIHHMTWQNHQYPMPIHGYIYHQVFQVIEQSQSHCQLRFQNQKIHKHFFPFDFDFDVNYQLIENKIEMTFDISNQSDNAMPIAPGLHPFFRTNYSETAKLQLNSDVYYKVTSDGKADTHQNEATIATALPDKILHNLIVKKNSLKPEALLQTEYGQAKFVTDSHFNYWVLLAQTQENSFCLEPWCGLPDVVNNKKGLIEIKPFSHYSLNLSLELLI